MNRPSHAGLRHLALNVRDLAAMKRFYVDLLGFAVEWEPDSDNVYLSSGIDNLALHTGTGVGGRSISDSRPPGQTLDHLGLIVREADDVDRWAAFLESRGVTIDARPRTHRDGARSCYFRDPDGNKVQVIHHPPISGKT
ncbi:MAG: VOC family protein [Acidobacteriia bacterium]|nr:VOC family protein [Terriglobia bacterium]